MLHVCCMCAVCVLHACVHTACMLYTRCMCWMYAALILHVCRMYAGWMLHMCCACYIVWCMHAACVWCVYGMCMVHLCCIYVACMSHVVACMLRLCCMYSCICVLHQLFTTPVAMPRLAALLTVTIPSLHVFCMHVTCMLHILPGPLIKRHLGMLVSVQACPLVFSVIRQLLLGDINALTCSKPRINDYVFPVPVLRCGCLSFLLGVIRDQP